ncbi:MAG: hypothetical protein IKB99_06660, partial [Lentisphaeria bacterium]|nr:hypothetical protein [Lentisphaeria bacterium]
MSVNYFEQKTEERGSTSVIWGLILVNALIYFIFGNNENFYDAFALACGDGFRPWQLLTAGFLHSPENFFH